MGFWGTNNFATYPYYSIFIVCWFAVNSESGKFSAMFKSRNAGGIRCPVGNWSWTQHRRNGNRRNSQWWTVLTVFVSAFCDPNIRVQMEVEPWKRAWNINGTSWKQCEAMWSSKNSAKLQLSSNISLFETQQLTNHHWPSGNQFKCCSCSPEAPAVFILWNCTSMSSQKFAFGMIRISIRISMSC